MNLAAREAPSRFLEAALDQATTMPEGSKLRTLAEHIRWLESQLEGAASMAHVSASIALMHDDLRTLIRTQYPEARV